MPARPPLSTSAFLNAVMWIQELWFGNFLIWSTEVFSPLIDAVPVRRGDRVSVLLNDGWRATNTLSVGDGF